MVSIGGLPLERSVVASIGKNPLDSARKAKKLHADLIELRIDLLDTDAREALLEIKKLGLPVIITNRMKQEGGAWHGSEEERIRTLLSLLHLADAVDIELCAAERDAVVKKAKAAGKTVIISTHDFQSTPEVDIMEGIINESFEAGADIAKLAVMPQTLLDVLHLLEITLCSSGKVCTIAMGNIGRHSRVVAPIYGSVMTYGYVDKPIASGQFRVDKLKSIFGLIT